jgi:hypothetical protein
MHFKILNEKQKENWPERERGERQKDGSIIYLMSRKSQFTLPPGQEVNGTSIKMGEIRPIVHF